MRKLRSGLKKVTKTVRGKNGTFRRAYYTKDGPAKPVHDNAHKFAKHQILIDYNTNNEQIVKQAKAAHAAILKAHTRGNTPPAFVARVGKPSIVGRIVGRAGTAHGHELVTEYAHHVMKANPNTTKRVLATLKSSGHFSDLLRKEQRAHASRKDEGPLYRANEPDVAFTHAYAQWLGLRAKGSGVSARTADPTLHTQARSAGVSIGIARKHMTKVARVFDEEFGGARSRSR